LLGLGAGRYVPLAQALGRFRPLLLTRVLAPNRIKVPITGQDKASVLRELVALVADNGDQFGDILEAVEARESVLSTGMGHGVAIPHGRSSTVADLRVAAGSAAAPVAFDALDGEPVRLFFLLVGPDRDAASHVKVLSRISRLMREEWLRERLVAARSGEEFYRVLCESESQ